MDDYQLRSQYQIAAYWSLVGSVTLSVDIKNGLTFNGSIPACPGVYKLCVQKTLCAYIGEGQNLLKRINNYANAGWIEKATKEFTNRRIQGWLLQELRDGNSAEIYICTEAFISKSGCNEKQLPFDNKYNRLIVESLAINDLQDDWTLKNKVKKIKHSLTIEK